MNHLSDNLKRLTFALEENPDTVKHSGDSSRLLQVRVRCAIASVLDSLQSTKTLSKENEELLEKLMPLVKLWDKETTLMTPLVEYFST